MKIVKYLNPKSYVSRARRLGRFALGEMSIKASQFSAATSDKAQDELFKATEARIRWLRLVKSKPDKPKVLFIGTLTRHDMYGMSEILHHITESSLLNVAFINLLDVVKEPSVPYEDIPRIQRAGGRPARALADDVIESYMEDSGQDLADSIECYIKGQDFSVENAATKAILLDIYFHGLLQFYTPDLVVLSGAFHTLSRTMKACCVRNQIPHAIYEPGVLPGTLELNFCGHMGESWVARYSSFFNSLPLDDQDIECAKAYIDHVRNTNISRRVKVTTGRLAVLGEKLKASGKKVLLYAGCADIYSGNFPYDDNARKHHSPFFRDSVEALYAVMDAVSGMDGMHLLAKPHPATYTDIYDRLEFNTDKVTLINKDISLQDCLGISDALCTILSQSNYEATLRDIPVVMLGINQLNGKGCMYELKKKDDLSELISRALEHGYTTTMREAFVRHVALLLRYCLFDMQNVHFGRKPEEIPKAIYQVMTGSHDEYLKYEHASLQSQLEAFGKTGVGTLNSSRLRPGVKLPYATRGGAAIKPTNVMTPN